MTVQPLFTASDDEVVKREWERGTEARQIALMLSATTPRTRNSIISRAHRLGLGKHPIAAAKRQPVPNLKSIQYRTESNISLAYIPTDAEIQRIAMELR